MRKIVVMKKVRPLVININPKSGKYAAVDNYSIHKAKLHTGDLLLIYSIMYFSPLEKILITYFSRIVFPGERL
jgi:hypothetical protein